MLFAGQRRLMITFHEGDEVPDALVRFAGTICSEIETKGDGACALHAVFGIYRTSSKLVEHHNPRAVAKEVLDQPLISVRRQLRPSMQHLLESVTMNLWSEFVVPYVQSG